MIIRYISAFASALIDWLIDWRCICCPIEKTDDTAVRFRDIENALYDLRRAILDQKGHPSEDVERQELSLDKEPGPSVSFKVEPARKQTRGIKMTLGLMEDECCWDIFKRLADGRDHVF